MYNHYFHLKGAPFSIAPDPRYLFMSERHREALAHLLYGIGSGGGFVLLTGEIGAGKTTVCRCFIEQIPENCRLAYIFNPRLSVEELLQGVCEELQIELPPAATPTGVATPGVATPGLKSYVDAINRYLLESHAQGLNNVLVIDEAQNLSAEVLEQLRLLTNLETSERKLLQIILIGQPELRSMLARPELEQLAQRVIARYHLGPLSEAETGAYVAHRLAVAGAGGAPFPPALTPLIHALAHGVPRRINLLCDRALLGAYVENSPQVTRQILKKAAAEVFAGEPAAPRRLRMPLAAGGVLAAAAVSAAAWQAMPSREPAPEPVARAAMPARAVPAAGKAVAPSTVPPVQAIEANALRELAALWGQPLAGDKPCEAALKMDLRCHQGRGGLYELRMLDRPAVVTLHDGPRTGYAVLSALDGDSVTLSAGARREKIDLATFVARFGGEFTTFWRMPRAFREELAEGARGPDVDWLAARLAQLDGAPAPRPGSALDAGTRKWLERFQAAQNLKADGLAGPRTYMRLNQLSGVPEPRLLAHAAADKGQ
ncbi:ExeA family protein [Massilia sp. BSC265]|uniref:ExeA family protein n=1 Tax=Massilia sp. BSC265 TaxID=1549812 RepID=UPI0004E8FA26|nr:ExeA family protein [Massilia sp. BSC265]KFI05495.1 peptidoglycan-binding protein [Massilia sp. BSC265]